MQDDDRSAATAAQVPGPRIGDDYPADVVEDSPEMRALLADVDKTARTLRTARKRAQDAADAADAAILAAVRAGVPKLAIVKRLGVARMTIEQSVRRAQEREAGDA